MYSSDLVAKPSLNRLLMKIEVMDKKLITDSDSRPTPRRFTLKRHIIVKFPIAIYYKWDFTKKNIEENVEVQYGDEFEAFQKRLQQRELESACVNSENNDDDALRTKQEKNRQTGDDAVKSDDTSNFGMMQLVRQMMEDNRRKDDMFSKHILQIATV
ncbi:hypothetical protein FQR65_LT18446 [Abscondita terminalis]|nr:hypothetical protein FQR65_LT18446 [Abscondita terminalis]